MTQQGYSILKLNITFEERGNYADLHLVSLSHFKIGQTRKQYLDFKGPRACCI